MYGAGISTREPGHQKRAKRDAAQSVPSGRQTEREDTREAEALVKLQLQRADHEPIFEQPLAYPRLQNVTRQQL
jgi:hypothetical protein